ncbi:MAG: hypothetical protein NTW59_00220, partial [Candidatus Diapherotrites archaeon]|nr:hypothetical protein [Candidatus Diapherotrites archaeon]
DILPEAHEKGISTQFVERLFSFAGNLSSWESGARQTWTRLHRATKPLIEEIGARAAKKGLIPNKKQIYKKETKEIIAIAEKIAEDG